MLAAGLDPSSLDVPKLFGGAQTVDDKISSPTGVTISQGTYFYPSQLRQVVSSLTLFGQLNEQSTENGQFVSTQTLDAGQRPTSYTDASGATWVYHYDAADRLRSVDMPDGVSQRIFYDNYGRVARIERDGIATIGESYDPTSGLLTAQTLYAPDGTPIRGASFGYDGTGRKLADTQTDLASGASTTYRYYWDGATPASSAAAGSALGLLTAVTGDGYVKLNSYRGDGLIVQHSLQLTGWQTVSSTIGYADDNSPLTTTTVVTRADGSVVSSTTSQAQHDPFGRDRKSVV